MDPEIALKMGFYLVFLFSVTLHEAGHAWAAHRLGDSTAYLGGQVTINPVPHIEREPFGMVILPLVTVMTMGWPMGFAHVPIDPYWADRNPRKSALVSLAGPGANLLLLLIAGIGMRVGLEAELFSAPNSIQFHSLVEPAGGSVTMRTLSILFSLLFIENLLLLIFNLIPIPPMDGSSALALFTPQHLVRKYREAFAAPMMPLIGLGIAWFLFAEFFDSAYLTAINIVYSGLEHYG